MEGGWMMMKDDGCFLARGEYLLVPGTKTYLLIQSFCLNEDLPMVVVVVGFAVRSSLTVIIISVITSPYRDHQFFLCNPCISLKASDRNLEIEVQCFTRVCFDCDDRVAIVSEQRTTIFLLDLHNFEKNKHHVIRYR